MAAYGGFWLRVVAYLIDVIALQIPLTILGQLTGWTMGMQSAAWDSMQVGASSYASGPGFVFSIIATWLYFALMESSSWQATLGKKAIGLAVTDDVGGRIGFGRATGRYFAKFVSAIVLCIGFLMVGWTQRKQGLHDMMAGTLVYKSRTPAEVSTDPAVFQ